MRNCSVFLAILPLCAAALGCGAGTQDSSDDLEDALKVPSLVFVTKEAKPLTLTLTVLDGVKEKTKNSRFIKVTAERGKKSFSSFCSLRGDKINHANQTTVGCMTGVTTVSDDDNESLEFDIIKKGSGFALVTAYSGDGTFLGNQWNILVGDDDETVNGPGVPLTLTKGASVGAERNPFALADRFFGALAPLAGEKIYLKDLGVAVSVKELGSWQLDVRQELFVEVSVGNVHTLEFLPHVSILKTPGILASGLASDPVLLDRAKAVLPTK